MWQETISNFKQSMYLQLFELSAECGGILVLIKQSWSNADKQIEYTKLFCDFSFMLLAANAKISKGINSNSVIQRTKCNTFITGRKYETQLLLQTHVFSKLPTFKHSTNKLQNRNKKNYIQSNSNA